MAFTVITSAEIAAGEPTKQDLFQTIKEDLDDHETRITATESFTVNTVPFKFDVQGPGQVSDGVSYIRIPYNITVTGVKLFVWKAGTSGTLTVDVERKVGAGSWSSILTTPVSAVYTSGDVFVQADSGLAITSIVAGGFLRLNIDAIQSGAQGFSVIVEYSL